MHIRSGIMNYFFIRFQKKGGNTYFWKLPVRWFFREIVVARKNWRFWNWKLLMQYFLCVCEWRRHCDLDQPCQICSKYCSSTPIIIVQNIGILSTKQQNTKKLSKMHRVMETTSAVDMSLAENCQRHQITFFFFLFRFLYWHQKSHARQIKSLEKLIVLLAWKFVVAGEYLNFWNFFPKMFFEVDSFCDVKFSCSLILRSLCPGFLGQLRVKKFLFII